MTAKLTRQSAMPRLVRRGQVLRDTLWNQLVRRVYDLEGGHEAPKQVVPSFGNLAPIRRFHVMSVDLDWLVCRAFDGSDIGTEDVFVAKPPLLRGSVTAYGSATYSGYNVTGTERTSTVSGETDETQVIVPAYITHSDIGNDFVKDIYAVKNPVGGTGVFVDSNDLETELSWLEISPARVWAKKDE